MLKPEMALRSGGMALSPAHPRAGRCSIATRIGAGRSLAFGALSAGLPALAHGASGLTVAVMVLAAATACAAWSWRTRCTPRSAVSLTSMLLLGQLLMHALLMVSPLTAPAGAATSGSLHAHASSDPETAAAGVALMAALHLVAVVYGVIALLALERRALRFVVDCVRRIGSFVGLGAAGAAALRAAPAALPAAPVGAVDADVRRARQVGRSRARRGPPRLAEPRLVAA